MKPELISFTNFVNSLSRLCYPICYPRVSNCYLELQQYILCKEEINIIGNE
jgi:hypothetical protein